MPDSRCWEFQGFFVLFLSRCNKLYVIFFFRVLSENAAAILVFARSRTVRLLLCVRLTRGKGFQGFCVFSFTIQQSYRHNITISFRKRRSYSYTFQPMYTQTARSGCCDRRFSEDLPNGLEIHTYNISPKVLFLKSFIFVHTAYGLQQKRKIYWEWRPCYATTPHIYQLYEDSVSSLAGEVRVW